MHKNTPSSHSSHLAHLAQGALPKTPDHAVKEMIARIALLEDLYKNENNALERVDIDEFLALQDQKLSYAQSYQQGVKEIIARQGEMRKVDPSLKRKLVAQQENFSQLAKTNMESLKRMQRTTDRLNNTIRDVAKSEVNKRQSYAYGESGQFHSNEKRLVSTGVSETA